jgi:hypothetical protein
MECLECTPFVLFALDTLSCFLFLPASKIQNNIHKVKDHMLCNLIVPSCLQEPIPLDKNDKYDNPRIKPEEDGINKKAQKSKERH